jgi:hypothetical protein
MEMAVVFGLYCYRQSDDFHEVCQQFKN